MSEREQLANMLMDSAPDVELYTRERHVIGEAMRAHLQGPNGKIDRIKAMPYYAQDILYAGSPSTDAALVMAAIAHKSYLYQEDFPQKDFAEIWRKTCVYDMAKRAQSIAEAITLQSTDRFTHVDLTAMHIAFREQILRGDTERVILTGLNGVGKTTVLNSLTAYLTSCGIQIRVQKYPRSDTGTLAEVNDTVLSGKSKLTPGAMQFVFLADALDSEDDVSGALVINDRHPLADALVYGPEDMQTSILAAHKLFSGPSHIVVLDRHPASALVSVVSRSREPRVLERKLEQMVHQTVRFAALNSLPGCRWINADVPSDDQGWYLKISGSRTIGSLITAGVVQRTMVRQGLAESEEAAYELAMTAYCRGVDEDKW